MGIACQHDDNQQSAALTTSWYEATHATRKGDLIAYVTDAGGEREGWRIRGNGSAAAIGFLGATPVGRAYNVRSGGDVPPAFRQCS